MARVRFLTALSPLRWLSMLLIAGLAYLDLQYLQQGNPLENRPIAAPALSAEPAAVEPSQVILAAAQLTIALRQFAESFPLPDPDEEPMGQGVLQWTHRRYLLSLRRPRNFDQFLAPFLALPHQVPGTSVAVQEGKDFAELQYGIAGLRTHTVRFDWIPGRPRVSLIVTGLGSDLLSAREFLAIEPRPSFAVSPFTPFSDVVAERLAAAGGEVLVDWVYPPESAPETEEGDLTASLALAFQKLPRASGLLLRAREETVPALTEIGFLAQLRGRAPLLVVWPNSWSKEVCSRVARMEIRCTSAEENLVQSPPDRLQVRLVAARMLAQQAGDRILLVPAEGSAETLREEVRRFTESDIALVSVANMLRDPLSSTEPADPGLPSAVLESAPAQPTR